MTTTISLPEPILDILLEVHHSCCNTLNKYKNKSAYTVKEQFYFEIAFQNIGFPYTNS